MSGMYELPKLGYNYTDLAPFLSEEQLRIHYEKHHAAYVKNANSTLERLDKARKENADVDVKAISKELSFNIGGHILHSMFWESLAPAVKSGAPSATLLNKIVEDYGSLERLKKEFSQCANSVEGSGWAGLVYCKKTKRLIIMQIEKHNVNVIPAFRLMLVLDAFEHAYYMDYKNDRAKYVESFWNNVNWSEVSKRYEEVI